MEQKGSNVYSDNNYGERQGKDVSKMTPHRKINGNGKAPKPAIGFADLHAQEEFYLIRQVSLRRFQQDADDDTLEAYKAELLFNFSRLEEFSLTPVVMRRLIRSAETEYSRRQIKRPRKRQVASIC